jgi:hypothetical protein
MLKGKIDMTDNTEDKTLFDPCTHFECLDKNAGPDNCDECVLGNLRNQNAAKAEIINDAVTGIKDLITILDIKN